MPETIFDDLKTYIGFTERDAANVRELAPYVAPFLGNVIDRFYAEILRHPDARNVITGGAEQVERLRKSLLAWISTLFCGRYDLDYIRQRVEIGRVHVRVGLPQHYMFGAMEVIWQELESHARQSSTPNVNGKLASLHKLLTLETGIMLESYKASYSEHVRGTEREGVQERLTQAEHLAQVGQMAASLAHEIKNPLAGISGAIQVIRESLALDDLHRPVLGEVLRQINRLDNTVKDLLVYSRPRPPSLRGCDLDHVIERVLAVVRGEPDLRGVCVEHARPAADGRWVCADEAQIEQLVINLVQNAVHASPDGATVTFRTAPCAGGVELRIEDRGRGMDVDVRRRAFEPFFTTKAKGTGLGLAICQRIVEAHGGTIQVESAVGRGTVVVVTLPDDAAAERERSHAHSRTDR